VIAPQDARRVFAIEFHSVNGKSSLTAARWISDRSSLDGRIYVKGEGRIDRLSRFAALKTRENPLPRIDDRALDGNPRSRRTRCDTSHRWRLAMTSAKNPRDADNPLVFRLLGFSRDSARARRADRAIAFPVQRFPVARIPQRDRPTLGWCEHRLVDIPPDDSSDPARPRVEIPRACSLRASRG